MATMANGGVALRESPEYEPIVELINDLAAAGPQPLPPPIPAPIPVPIPVPLPFSVNPRVMIWKQDPTVGALGRRLAMLPGLVLNGPLSSRVATSLSGTTPVVRNPNGDFIFLPPFSAESDCVHTYSVVSLALRMWEQTRAGKAIPWAWNSPTNTDKLTCQPRGFTGANAFYSRTGKTLSFGSFDPAPPGGEIVFTCRSFDIVSHETGHAVLDGLKPGWLGTGNVPQTGGMHEAFGDLTAVFLALSQFDQVEAFVALSKGNLHQKNFLAAVAEQFGMNLSPPRLDGLRNADNDLKLSQVANQVHALSQVFTGAIYDILADIFAHERALQAKTKDAQQVLYEVAQGLRRLLLRAILAAPASGATFADVANEMIRQSKAMNQRQAYRTFIKNRFVLREVVVTETPLTAVAQEVLTLDYADENAGSEVEGDLVATEHVSMMAGVPQDRSGCCGTMQLPEYDRPEDVLESELTALRQGEEVPPDSPLDDEIEELKRELSSQ